MHLVTKVLVVFGAILSIFLSALTIAYTSNAEALRKGFDDLKAKSSALQANLTAAEGRNTADLTGALREAESARGERNKLVQESIALKNEVAKLLADKQAAQVSRDEALSQNNTLSEASRANATLIQSLTEELRGLRKVVAEGAKRETELVGRVNELDRDRTVLQQETRAMREQLAEARRALEQAQSGGASAAAGGKATAVEAVSGPRVVTKVRELVSSPAGAELVVIPEGSNAGLRENTLMTIVRGTQFIANLVIVKVDANESVGRVEKLGRDVKVQVDDVVLSRLN